MKVKIGIKIFRCVIITGTCLLFSSVIEGRNYSLTGEHIRCFLDSAERYRKDAPDKTILYMDSLIKILDDTFALQKAEALRFRSMANKQKSHYEKAIADCYVSLKIEEENSNPKGQIATLNLLGNIYKVQRKYDRAVDFYIKSLKISESLYPNAQETSDVYNKLGSIFSVRKKFNEALNYFDKALIIKEAAYKALSNPKEDENVTKKLAAIYHDVGNMYLRMDSLDIAVEYYKQSTKLNETVDNHYALARTYGSIGIICYKQKKYQKAVSNYEKSLGIKEKLSDKRGIAVINTNLCELYCQLNNYEKALPYCNKSIEDAKEVKDYKVLENTNLALYKMAKTKDNDKAALAHYEFYTAYRDSLNSNNKDIEIQKIITQYKTDKERAETEKQDAIDKQKTQVQKNLLGTGMFSTLFTTLGLLFYSRSKKKLHQEEQKRRIQEEQLRKETEGRRIEEQKLYNQVIKTLEKDAEIQAVNAEIDAKLRERTKVASTLHDSVCSSLVSARMHMESVQNNIVPQDKAVFARGFGLLDEAYNICREISHDLSPPMLAKFGLAQAIEDLCERFSTPQICIQFSDTSFDERLYHQQELTLYQSIQELLQNILKHSAASEAHVQLTDYGDSLNILVEDDGKGFDTAEISDNSSGLQRIRTRIKHLGGNMDVDSSPGNGTTVIIDVPKTLSTHEIIS